MLMFILHGLLYISVFAVLSVSIIAAIIGGVLFKNKRRNKQIVRYAKRIEDVAIIMPRSIHILPYSERMLHHKQLLEWAEESGITVINSTTYSGPISSLPTSGRVLLCGHHLHNSPITGNDLIFLCKSDAMLYKLAFHIG